MTEKRTISENITYNAHPHQPMLGVGEFQVPNLFPTNKFEGFKICCGQCYHLAKTDAVLATRNVCCALCCTPCWKMCCPEELKRMEHYCTNCGALLAAAQLPIDPGCPSLCAHWTRTIPHVEAFKATMN